MADNFSEDVKIQQIAEAYALDAIDFARNFHLKLDWADNSVAKVESILDILFEQRAKARPTEEQVWGFAKMLGSYVGEVYRKNHGATWGIIRMDGGEFPGLRATTKEALFWPWSKVHKRLTNGPEDNVWHYYRHLVEQPAP